MRQRLYYPSSGGTAFSSRHGQSKRNEYHVRLESRFHVANSLLNTGMYGQVPSAQSVHLLELDSALASSQIPPPHVSFQHDSAVPRILPLAL